MRNVNVVSINSRRPSLSALALQAFEGKGLLLSEQDMLQLASGSYPQQGTCELCGQWDSQLVEGVGACCRERYISKARIEQKAEDDVKPAELGRQRLEFLPLNDRHWKELRLVMRALIELDDAACLVRNIKIMHHITVIELERSPDPSLVTCVFAFKRMEDVRLTDWYRADFRGISIEWRAA